MILNHSNDRNAEVPTQFLIYSPDGVPQTIHLFYQITTLIFIALYGQLQNINIPGKVSVMKIF